jgi:hypothetical protein
MGDQRSGVAMIGLKEECIKTRDVFVYSGGNATGTYNTHNTRKRVNGVPYKVYNSVPLVLYLKPFHEVKGGKGFRARVGNMSSGTCMHEGCMCTQAQ